MNNQWKHRADSLAQSTGKPMVVIEHSDTHCQIWNKSVAKDAENVYETLDSTNKTEGKQ